MTPFVFISYSNDSPAHVRRVHELAAKLHSDGVTLRIDKHTGPGGPAEGWSAWCECQLETAERVLVVCTERYRRRYDRDEDPGVGLGATWEAAVIRRLLVETSGRNEKFRVILFHPDDRGTVPVSLRDYEYFPLYEGDGYDNLLQWLQDAVRRQSSSQPDRIVRWPAALRDYPWPLAGRRTEVAAFTRMASGKSNTRILLMKADSNRGKTALVNEFFSYACQAGLAASHVDLKGSPPLDDVLERIHLDLNRHLSSASARPSTLRPAYQMIQTLEEVSGPVMLVFDTYEQASGEVSTWLEAIVLPRLVRNPALLVVIGGQRLPVYDGHGWHRLAEMHELLPIVDVQAWVDFVRQKWKQAQLDPQAIKTLMLATRGNPGHLSSLLETLIAQSSELRSS